MYYPTASYPNFPFSTRYTNCNWSVDSVSRTHYYILFKLTIGSRGKCATAFKSSASLFASILTSVVYRKEAKEQEKIPITVGHGSKRKKNIRWYWVLQFSLMFFNPLLFLQVFLETKNTWGQSQRAQEIEGATKREK